MPSMGSLQHALLALAVAVLLCGLPVRGRGPPQVLERASSARCACDASVDRDRQLIRGDDQRQQQLCEAGYFCRCGTGEQMRCVSTWGPGWRFDEGRQLCSANFDCAAFFTSECVCDPAVNKLQLIRGEGYEEDIELCRDRYYCDCQRSKRQRCWVGFAFSEGNQKCQVSYDCAQDLVTTLPATDTTPAASETTPATTETTSATTAEATTETTPATTAEATTETTPATTAEATTETTPATTAEATTETTPATTAEATTETTPATTAEATTETTPVTTAEATTETTPVTTAEATTETTPVTTAEATAETTPATTAEATTEVTTAEATTEATPATTPQISTDAVPTTPPSSITTQSTPAPTSPSTPATQTPSPTPALPCDCDPSISGAKQLIRTGDRVADVNRCMDGWYCVCATDSAPAAVAQCPKTNWVFSNFYQRFNEMKGECEDRGIISWGVQCGKIFA
ncbi:hypothetical protein ONE63_004599 [Megalurothrips usitatus]|uniref:Uncharacterized protein n=1 Tax=Megalurothrips usitatus TaxID=439358 RepID=A0AAV7X6Q6_9NEOP|nr:hypothetical protein ONE63_004599 [Megalurothrips usitatus]